MSLNELFNPLWICNLKNFENSDDSDIEGIIKSLNTEKKGKEYDTNKSSRDSY